MGPPCTARIQVGQDDCTVVLQARLVRQGGKEGRQEAVLEVQA